jgi:hypothetical protein
MKLNALMKGVAIVWIALLGCSPVGWSQNSDPNPNQVLDWNQIFIDSLILTNTAGAVSDRLAAIVHTAIFDAYNGIERRYKPIFVQDEAPRGASRRAAVIAAAHTALLNLFPSRQQVLDDAYAASLAALSDDGEDGGESRDRGIGWGTFVAQSVLAWRANDGFSLSYPRFPPLTDWTPAPGQWRPTLPLFAPMSAQQLAFVTPMFVLDNNQQFRPDPPRRALTDPTYTDDFNAVKAFGGISSLVRTADQAAIAQFWDGSPSIHWNQAANQMARANQLSISDSNRLLAVLNIAMADTRFTTWSAKRAFGDVSSYLTWRPITAIQLADPSFNPGTIPDSTWLPLIPTPAHPEYPAGHPSANGAGATVVLIYFGGLQQTFKLTTPGQPDRTYNSIAQARSDGDNARVWGGLHYPSTVAISDAEGEAIANYVNQNSMQPRHGQN